MNAPPEIDDGGEAADGSHCRVTCNYALSVLVELLEEASRDGRVTVEDIHRIAKAIMGTGGPLGNYYRNAEARCAQRHAMALDKARRSDFVSRVVVETFCHLFDDPESGITRRILPRFLTALHMMLGDDLLAECRETCIEVAEENNLFDKSNNDWTSFHADRRCIWVRERVLIAVAGRFRRFEVRKQWFITLMNTEQSTESIGSHAFIPKARDPEEALNFTGREFHLLFSALFSSVHPGDMDEARSAEFLDRFGIEPNEAFGRFLVELANLGGGK